MVEEPFSTADSKYAPYGDSISRTSTFHGRLAVLSFLPHLVGRNILLDEDNEAVCYVLAGVASRSLELVEELRRLWLLLDNNNVHIKPHYIRSGANTWVDKLSRHFDNDDLQLDPIVLHDMDTQLGPHTIDRFALALNMLLPRYDANWLDPSCEAMDALHLSDAHSRDENNWCNLPWRMVPDLAQKSSRAA
jgi:hypothetical protein